jgi:hypothetical protein
MPRFRAYFYLVPLPSGKVLAIGGPGQVEMEGDPNQVPPDEWDPYENVWRTYDNLSGINLDYQSSAVLLPDGSVFIGGGTTEPRDSKSYQIFKPDYFFDWRPTIDSAPSSIYYNQGFNVQTADAELITKVRLIRLGAATHSFDQDTRSLELDFIVLDSNRIRVAPPTGTNAAPPGHYMLFIAGGSCDCTTSRQSIRSPCRFWWAPHQPVHADARSGAGVRRTRRAEPALTDWLAP